MVVVYYHFIRRRGQYLILETVFRDIDNPIDYLDDDDTIEMYRLSRLFVFSFSSHSRIFHSFGDVTIAGAGLQILTCAQHLWPLSNQSSLACRANSLTHWAPLGPFFQIYPSVQNKMLKKNFIFTIWSIRPCVCGPFLNYYFYTLMCLLIAQK